MINKCKNGIIELKKSTPLENYLWLINNKADQDYGEHFKQFFGMNRLKKNQRERITKFILGVKKYDSFGELVLLMDTSKYQFSFASKIMHMADTNLPIYDSHIANTIHWKFQNRKYKLNKCQNKKQRKENELNRLWNEFQKTWNEYTKKDSKHCCELFDKAFPRYKHLSTTKKIDFMLWANSKA